MPVDESYDIAHQANTINEGSRAGCHNRRGFVLGYWAPDRVYGGDRAYRDAKAFIVDQMSRKCRQIGEKHGSDWKPLPDCVGCTAEKDEEFISNARAAISREMQGFIKVEQRAA